MDALKLKPKGFRIAFTSCGNKIDQELMKETPKLKELSNLNISFGRYIQRLTCQEEISDSILQKKYLEGAE